MKEIVKISNRGWAGHFICSKDCQFRLNTLLEYKDIKIVVSTVGMMLSHCPKGSEFYKGQYDTVGLDRYYETMAFHAKSEELKYKSGKKQLFYDVDVSRQISFDSDWCWESIEDEWEANKGHYKVVEEIKKKLLKGNKFEN